MAADVVLESESSNACCADLKKKYLKVKSERNFLKQGLKAIEVKTDKLVQENLQLKKAYKEEQLHGKQEKEEKIKESSIRQKLEKEIHNLKAEISSYQKNGCLIHVNDDNNQLIKAQDEIKRLKELIQKEKKKCDSEMKNVDSEKKKAAEAWKLVKVEKNKAEEERKLAEIERKKAEDYRLCLEKLNAEVKDVREKLNAEISKADDAKKRVEAGRRKTSMEKTRADSQAMKAVKQKRIMEVERKRAIDEKVRADRLSQMLEEEKQRREELQKKLEETLSSSKVMCDSCNGEERHSGNVSLISANMKLLRRQLKLEKKQAKCSKRMAKLEKAEKDYIMQEIHILKHSFMQILSRFNMLDDCLSHSIEGTDAAAKIGKSSEIHHGFKLENKLLGSKRGNHHSRIGCGLTKTCCMGSFNITEPTRECICLPLPRGCTRSTTGITSELESPIGGSNRNKSQSSAICSNASFSDKGSMGSQERGSIAVTASGKLTKKHPSKKPTAMKLCSEVAKTGKSEELGVMANSVDKICDRRQVINACLTSPNHDQMEEVVGEFDRNSKRRKIQDARPVARVHTENNQSHFEIEGKLYAFKDILNIGGVTALNCSQICGTSQNFHNGVSCFSEGHSQSCRLTCNQTSSPMASKQQTPVLQALDQNGNQKQCGKFDSQRSRGPSFIAETTPFSDQLRGNICIEQEGIALSNEQSDLIISEDMIRENCLKLLDLDNDADEERYRMAAGMPLSPTLPKFELPELPNHQQCVDNDTQSVIERDNLVPLHAVDVMVTEIRASNAAWELLSHEGRDSLYPTMDPGKTSVIELQNCVSQHGRPDSVEDNPSLSINHKSLDVEQRHPPGKSGNNMIDTVMVPFLGENIFPNPNICTDSTSDVIDDPLLSGAMAGSYILQDDGFLLSSTEMIDNFKSNASSVVNRQNEACGHADITPSSLIESQKDEVDVPDGVIVSIKDQMLSAEIREFANGNNDLFNVDIAKRDSIHQLSASNQTAFSTGCSFIDSSSANPRAESGETPVFCVVFSNILDRDSISRILHARNSFSHQSFMVSEIDHAVVQAHNALAKNTVLLPEEKGSVFFSLLLCNISSRMTANFKCTMGEYLLPCFKSFAAEINKVLSDAEARSLFEEICPFNILAGLIEDFLIERKIFMCIDRDYECKDKSSDSFQLDGAYVFSRTATMNQFAAGCIILASIFAAADRICFLLEASYRILRMCRKNLSWILLALHIFASVCGKEYFNVNEYSFLIIALRSVVLLLERGHQSVSSISPCLHEELETEPNFPPCNECPFAAGAVCMDKLVDILLDVVRCYVLTGVGYRDINNSVNFSVYMVPASSVRDEESRELHGQTNTSHASCSLFTFRKHAAYLPDCFPDRAFCHFSDIVALLELVGSYTSWEWTNDKIIPHLSKILESCESEEFSAALFVLIGQLGRFGIDAGGHQKRGIAELRCNISVFVDKTIARETGLPTQFAAIGALLNLLPLRFRDIVGEYEKLTPDTSQSDLVKLMKKWFSNLSKQRQSLALNLFGQDNWLVDGDVSL